MKTIIVVVLFILQYQSDAQNTSDPIFRILTHDEFGALGERDLARVNKRPYILEGSHATGGKLYYYGSSHVYNPEDPMVKDIEQKWYNFKPDIVFWEGGNPDRAAEFMLDKTTAIKEKGEAGLMRYLAKENAVPDKTLEPSPFAIITELRKKYSDTEIFIHGVLTQTEQAKRKGKNDSELDAIVIDAIQKAKRVGFIMNIDNLNQFAKTVDSIMVGSDWHNVTLDRIAPKTSNFLNRNIVQEIAVESSAIRDRYMINLLLEEVRKGKKVFAVVGASHVIMQEPGICQFFGTPYKE